MKSIFDNNLFNLNCTFIGEIIHSRPDLCTKNVFFTPQIAEEKEFNISKKINFSNNELKIYFDECCNLDIEKNKGNLIELTDEIPNIDLNNSNEKEDENEKIPKKNSSKIKLNPILKIFLKCALIALLLGAAIAISVLTFGTGAIPLTFLGTALATKIGIGIATSILIGIGLFFSVKFISNDCKRKNNKYEELNDNEDKQIDQTPAANKLWVDYSKENSIEISNVPEESNTIQASKIPWVDSEQNENLADK